MLKLTIFIAPLLGLSFCLHQALGINLAIGCASAGCQLTADFAILGLSLYWYGAAYFLALLILLLLGQNKYALILSALAVGVDVTLKAILAFLLPCSSCMVAGGLMFATFVFLAWPYLKSVPTTVTQNRSVLLLSFLWLLVFAPNATNLGREYLGPKPIYGSSDAPINIFFSPNCPSCKDMIEAVYSTNSQGDASFFPVALTRQDRKDIRTLDFRLNNRTDFLNALNGCCSDEHPDEHPKARRTGDWKLFLMSYLNRQFLLSLGKYHVPVMISNQALSSRNHISLDNLFSKEQGSAEGCGFFNSTDCFDAIPEP